MQQEQQQKQSQEEKKKLQKQKMEHKKEIVSELKFAGLRDKLTNYLTNMLAYNQISQSQQGSEINRAIAVLNSAQLELIMEERVSNGFCCNLYCKNQISQEQLKKELNRQYKIHKSGKVEKIEKHLIFCDSLKDQTQTGKDNNETQQRRMSCEAQYNRIIKQVSDDNEGGPFSTSTNDTISLLQKACEIESTISESEKENILKTIAEFEKQKSKLVAPIVERKIISMSNNNNNNENHQPNGAGIESKVGEGKANQNFKVNIVSNRLAPILHSEQATKQNTNIIYQDTPQAENQQEQSQESSTSVSRNAPVRKSVRFEEGTKEISTTDNYLIQKEQITKMLQDDDASSQNSGDGGSNSEGDWMDFDGMHQDLEEYRQSGMSSFQKLNSFFMDLANDYLYYYATGKKSYDQLEAFPKSSIRDFVHRQLKVQIDDQILPKFTQKLKQVHKQTLDTEINKILDLMRLESFTYSFTKEEWELVGKIFIKLAAKVLSNHSQTPPQSKEEHIQELLKIIDENVVLEELDLVHLDVLC